MNSIRVLLVDDYEPFRRAVVSRLRDQPTFVIVAEASDGLEAIHKAKELQPDLILLDVGLPKLNGIEAARQIRQLSPGSRILFVSELRSDDIAEAALNTGASGYVVKSNGTGELLYARETVLKDERFSSAGLDNHDNMHSHTQTSEGECKITSPS